jgi:hypothetical protein
MKRLIAISILGVLCSYAFAAPPSTTQPNISALALTQCILNAQVVGGGAGSSPNCYGVVTGTDSNLNIASTTNAELTPSSLSATRTWTLPTAAAYGKGNHLLIVDAAGAITGGDDITIARAGSDTINGTTSFSIATQYTVTELISDGVSKWAVQVSAGSGTVTSVATVGAGGLTTTGTCTITIAGTCTLYTPGGYLNKFRNGTIDVWQRGTSALATSSGGSYTADGWIVAQAGAQGSCAQDTGNNGTLFSLKCVGASSNTDTTFAQRIESYISTPLAGATVTVQFQYKQDTGSAITPKISTCYASSTDNFGTCTSDLSSTSLTSCSSGTWCTEAYTLSVSANASKGYQVTLDCNTALSGSQHCWTTANDIRVTPGVSTGVNSNPPPPELRPVAAELEFCHRYLFTFTGTYPGGYGDDTSAAGLSTFGQFFSFPAVMRVAPSVSISGSWTTTNTGSVTMSDITAGGMLLTGSYSGAGVATFYPGSSVLTGTSEL